jgi:hypothetical protein
VARKLPLRYILNAQLAPSRFVVVRLGREGYQGRKRRVGWIVKPHGTPGPMKNLIVLATLSLALVLGACKSTDHDPGSRGEEEHESPISAAEVPPAVTDAALAAVPGLVISGVEVEGDGVYCVCGMGGFTYYEVHVDSKTGEVLWMLMNRFPHETSARRG